MGTLKRIAAAILRGIRRLLLASDTVTAWQASEIKRVSERVQR